MAECPVCGVTIKKMSDTVKGEVLECPDCGTEVEVTSLEPFALAEAPQEAEDWGQ